jgi:hypothetical protein
VDARDPATSDITVLLGQALADRVTAEEAPQTVAMAAWDAAANRLRALGKAW